MPGEVVADVKAALTGRLAHDDLAVYNAVQKLLYVGVILAGVVIVLSGLAIWKPVQLQNADRAVRRLRCRPLCALPRHGGDRRLRRDPRGHGIRGAEEPARHDHRALRRDIMSRIRKYPARRRSEAAGQGRREAPARSGAAAVPARRREPRRARGALRLRHHRQPVGREGADEDFLFQRPGAGAAVQSQHAGADLSGKRDHAPVPVQRLLPRGGRARGRQGGLQARSRAAWSTTRSPGRSTSSTRCRRRRRSPATSASRAGARSANGRACASPNSCSASAPTRARNTSGSAAPRAIRPRSTWRPRCIRRRR